MRVSLYSFQFHMLLEYLESTNSNNKHSHNKGVMISWSYDVVRVELRVEIIRRILFLQTSFIFRIFCRVQESFVYGWRLFSDSSHSRSENLPHSVTCADGQAKMIIQMDVPSKMFSRDLLSQSNLELLILRVLAWHSRCNLCHPVSNSGFSKV